MENRNNGDGDKATVGGEAINSPEAQAIAEKLVQSAMGDTSKVMGELIEEQEGVGNMPMQSKLGVLQRIVTAVANDKEYRQILLLAAFDNKQEAMLASDAITERQRYGVPIKPILDRIVAQCSVGADRIDRVLKAMTSYTLNSNQTGGKVPFWKKKQEDHSLS